MLQALADIERAQPVGEHETIGDIGWRAHHQLAQHVHDPIEHRVVIRQALRIAGRPLRDFRLRVLTAETERAPVGQRQEVCVRSLGDAQAVLVQAQVADHLGIEQADRVAGSRVAEAGKELLGHRRAANDAAPFQHPHLQAGAGEIRRAHQAVVAATDDQCVAGFVGLHRSVPHERTRRIAGPTPAAQSAKATDNRAAASPAA